MMKITGNELISWGHKPGPWFSEALEVANMAQEQGFTLEEIKELVADTEPEPIPTIEYRTNSREFATFIEAENDIEQTNVDAVNRAMDELMRTPTIESAAIMPDACPAGVIPVGGVVATKNAIHPGFHSADVCCSMAVSVFKRDEDTSRVLDVIEKFAHFGPRKRDDHPAKPSKDVMDAISENGFLKGLEDSAMYGFTTQGDGNHFYFVGHVESTGQLAIVSHHGSRGLGANLYKRGMQAAQRHTAIVSPRTPKQAAWIEADSEHGETYWEALQIVRQWTKENHYTVHDLIARALGNKVVDRFWNEHNFVFQKSDGLFYHAKGATPSYAGFSEDDVGTCLIPMNMAEPILMVEHGENEEALEFAPHGAGRNMSRKQFLENYRPKPPEGIEARFYCGVKDLSELPEAYKSAEQVTRKIEEHKLAHVTDRIIPSGSMMAGDWEKDAPWRNKKKKAAE